MLARVYLEKGRVSDTTNQHEPGYMKPHGDTPNSNWQDIYIFGFKFRQIFFVNTKKLQKIVLVKIKVDV